MKIALTITVYNDWPRLVRTLESVARQKQMPDELIVADDGSEKSLGENLAQWSNSRGVQLKHVWHPDDGFRKCELLNKAAIESHSDYILYVDHDCLLPRSFVKAHMAFAQEDMIHLGPRVHVLPPLSASFQPSPASIVSAIARRKLVAWRGAMRQGRIGPKPPEIIEGCNMLIPSKVLHALNGFDNRYRAWGYGEDADIVVRGWQGGHRIGTSGRGTTVYHMWHPSNETQVNRDLFHESMARRVPRCANGLESHLGARMAREVRGTYTAVRCEY